MCKKGRGEGILERSYLSCLNSHSYFVYWTSIYSDKYTHIRIYTYKKKKGITMWMNFSGYALILSKFIENLLW